MKRLFLLLALSFPLLAPSSWATYQPTITVSSSALPTGAALSANQVPGGPQTGSGEVTATTQRVYNANARIIDCSFTKTGSGLVSDEAVQVGVIGAGMTVSQAFGNLQVDTGTTANSDFLMRSVESIKGGHIARVKVILSQKIVNQHFGVYLADLIGENCAWTTDATGLLISVTLPSGHGFTSAHIGQSCYLGGASGAAIEVPGRYAITAVSGDVVTFSPVFTATWSRATTTATVTFNGGNPIYSIGETATVSASSDVAAVANGAITLANQSSGGVFTLTVPNAGATAGTLTLTMSAKAWTPSASGVVTVFGWNCVSLVKNGTSPTTTNWYDSQRKGWGSGATSLTLSTDASPGAFIQFSGDTTSSFLADNVPGTTTSVMFSQRASRLEGLVDANTPLYLFIQAYNGVTAPASTTRLTVGKFSLEETGINKVIIAGVSATGQSNAQRVTVDSGTVTTTGTITSATPSLNAESSTVLAASATYTGGTRDGGSTAVNQRFVARAYASHAGTLRVDHSTDGTTWRRATADIAVAADGVATADVICTTRYHRVVYVNGATLQTAFLCSSVYLKL